MLLYHGSNTPIETIELKKCRPYKDFGQGFYMTDIPAQASRMAQRTTKITSQYFFHTEEAIKLLRKR